MLDPQPTKALKAQFHVMEAELEWARKARDRQGGDRRAERQEEAES